MNEYLAQLYGTGGYTEEDLEKVAAYEMLTKLAEEEGVDLDALDDETVEELVNDLSGSADTEGPQLYEDEEGNILAQGDDGELYYVDPSDFMDEEEKLAEAQLEEADFLGRTMAHAYAQEMGLIEAEFDDDGDDDVEYIDEYDDDDPIDKLAAAYAEELLEKEAFESIPSKLDPKPMKRHAARRYAAQLKYGKKPRVSAEAGPRLTKEQLKGYKVTRPSAKQRKATAAAEAKRVAALPRASKKQRAARKAEARVRRGVTTQSARKAREAAMAEKNTLKSRIGGYHRGAVSDIMGKGIKGNRGWKRQAMRRGRGLAKLSPHAAAAGLGAYGGYKALTKEASIEDAIEERAYELLALEGYLE